MLSHAQVAPQGSTTPVNTPVPIVQPPASETLPVTEDPNDPMASKEERIRRQRILIQKRIEARKQRDQQRNKSLTPQPLKGGPQPYSGAKTPNAPAKPGQPGQPGHALAVQGIAPGQGQGKDKKELRLAGTHYVSLFLKPGAASVLTGERFVTECRIFNPDHLSMDSVEILLSFPQRFIRPISIHQSEILPLLKGEPECRVDDKQGTLVYRGQFKAALNALEVPLITIAWEALAPTDSIQIDPAIGGHGSTVFWKGKRLTESTLGMNETVRGTVIRILAHEGDTPQGDRIVGMSLDDLQMVESGFRKQANLRLPTLWIDQPAEGVLNAGEWLVVDIGIENPDRRVFKEVRLTIKYPPDAVEIIDSDRANWIDGGINLLDGPFHEMWPWDIHIGNVVIPQRGLIYYDMATQGLREQPSGTIARLFARIKKPVEAPLFNWVWNENAPIGQPSTGIFLFNQNLYAPHEDQIISATKSRDLDSILPGGTVHEKADPAVYRSGAGPQRELP